MEDYRKEFKTEILKQSLIARVISPLVNVSEEEVKKLLHTTDRKYKTNKHFKIKKFINQNS